MRNLILLRGVPGSGKSTLAGLISPYNVAADDYFMKFHKGKFIPGRLGEAHDWCWQTVRDMMQDLAETIVVHNTFTREWEMQNYEALAQEHGYRVHTVIVENRHGSESIHSVPQETIEKMKSRFDIKL